MMSVLISNGSAAPLIPNPKASLTIVWILVALRRTDARLRILPQQAGGLALPSSTASLSATTMIVVSLGADRAKLCALVEQT